MNVRLVGQFQLRSPLSHIGESISTTSYLVQEPILQQDGSIEEVFSYSGNAWRGQLRDLAATYMLERLGSPQLPTESFHLLFSGGRIGGEQIVDINRIRAYRRAVPLIALWGGGIGNMILPGKLRVSNAYPICHEAQPVLPPWMLESAQRVSYRGLTFEKSFSRKDDARDERLTQFLAGVSADVLTDGTQSDWFDALEGPAVKPRRRDDGPADQMRMTAELLIAGAALWSEIDLLDVNEVELGCLTSALHLFSRSPHIGGQASRGHGLADLAYEIVDLDTGERQPFLTVEGGSSLLAPRAHEAKTAYDKLLRDAYDAYLSQQGTGIVGLLGSVK